MTAIPSADPNILREENQRLRRAVEELSILNDLARVIGGTMNTQEIMQTIIHRSLRAVQAEQGVITLVDQTSKHTMKTLVRSAVNSSDNLKFHLTESMLGWMHLNKKPLMVNDPGSDERFRGIAWDAAVRNALSVPMTVKSTMIGVLTVYNKKDQKAFSDDDQRLLAILATQSAQVVENARLYEQEKALAHMQEEVRLAARIQTDLLPKTFPEIPGYDVAAVSRAAQTIGGDYFDFIPLEQHRIAVCLGDVAGKGLAAALLMASLHAALRTQSVLKPTPGRCLERTNQFLRHSISSEKFATLFYGILDFQAHTLQSSNGGHDHPVLLSDQGMTMLGKGGIPLGMVDPFSYEEETHPIHPGDVLVIFSDGVTEAWNSEDDMYGSERLVQTIQAHRQESARTILEKILSSVAAFAGPVEQADDITMIVLKRQSV